MDMSTTEQANLTVNKDQPSVEEPQPVAEQASQAAERSEVSLGHFGICFDRSLAEHRWKFIRRDLWKPSSLNTQRTFPM